MGGFEHSVEERPRRDDHGLVARTKFVVPRIPSASVRRTGLIARLDAATSCPLSLVVAAPGSGKSALLAQWVEAMDVPVAWMSCDASDGEPGAFWRSLATAIGLAWRDSGMAAAELADTGRSEELTVGLANELDSLAQPGVIVVDDLHLARPEPAVVKAFVDALPPHVRLVVGSRRDPPVPLGRLRVQGRLLELRQADLRFSDAEAQRLLAQLGVDVDEHEVAQIAAVTEGWTAGVHLAGLWIRAHGDAASLLGGLAESERGLADFLVGEVIEVQPPEVAEFLMASAELETFDAAICDAALERADSREMLRRVADANLFLTKLDHVDGRYRYHHLFGQFLRGRLRAVAPGRAGGIHRAAAAACADRGDLVNAADHSMKAGDTGRALAQLQSHVAGTWSLEDQTTAGATIRAWLQEHGADQVERAPPSVLACTAMLNAIGQGEHAGHWLRLVDAREPELDAEGRFLLHGAWGFHLLQHGDPAGALARAEKADAVRRSHVVDSPWVQPLSNVVVVGRLWLDDLDGAEAALDALRLDPAQPPVMSQVRVPGFASHIAVGRGELVDARRLASSALMAARRLGLSDANFGLAEPHLSLAVVELERYCLDDAEDHLERVLRIVEGGRRPPLELLARLHLAEVLQVRGDEDAAADAVKQARAVLPHATAPVVSRIDQVELRLALGRGDLEVAEAIHRRLPPSSTAMLLAARVRLAVDDRVGALRILEPAASSQTSRRFAVQHRLLCARALSTTDVRRARELLRRALELGRPVGFMRTFVAEGPALWSLLESLPAHGEVADFVADILDTARGVLPPPRTATGNGLVEPLSDRELTVLRYLASRLTSTEIARELYLSVNTVRSHVKAVYRKLGVGSRTDAVRRGQALGVT